MSKVLLLLCAVLAADPAIAIDADEMFADPGKEQRAREVGKQLRCMVCQNQSIFDSNADLARDLRRLVRERIDAGDSDAAILQHVAARYGDFVLLQPPLRGATVLLWGTPPLLLLVALAAGAAYLRRMGAAAQAAADRRREPREQAR